LVGIQPEPYDADTYSASLEEKDYRGFVHSMIRWRYARTESGELKRDEHGKLVRESNARLVAWDDGSGGPRSYTLCVGDEVLEVDTIDSSSNGFAGLNGYLYLSQKATLADDDHTLAGTVLESMGAIQSRLIARPSSLESAAHKSLTVAVRQKTIKTARIAEYVTQEDPEKLKLQKIKMKQDLDKSLARKKVSYSNRRSTPAMNRRYLEQEDDGMYDTINIKDMKRGREYEEMDYGEDSEDEDEEEDDTMFNRRKPAPGRAARAASRRREAVSGDDDEEDELVFEEESDDDEIKATSKKKIQHQALVDDDDDD
jgi:RNA polymerase-associated protein LEO1